MATAGSGDVLTGLLLALLAQGYSATNAALLGVYTHGLAGDLCFEKETYEGLTASVITSYSIHYTKLYEMPIIVNKIAIILDR